MRSSFGVPISPFTNDGVTLLDQTVNFSTSFLDTPLMSGRFRYYSLFVFDTDVNEWLLSSSCQGLCLTDFGFPAIYTGWTPDWEPHGARPSADFPLVLSQGSFAGCWLVLR